jgi:HKD family nuclease
VYSISSNTLKSGSFIHTQVRSALETLEWCLTRPGLSDPVLNKPHIMESPLEFKLRTTQNVLITNEKSEELKTVLAYETNPHRLLTLQRVDLICAYITETGRSELENFFLALASRKPPVPMRLLTTSQYGTTDPITIHKLSMLPAVEIKIFWPTHLTFHAKGWHFVHNEGACDSAIVGSSNMSKSAVGDGIEWNIRTTDNQVIGEFREVFESYWNGIQDTSQPLRRGGVFSGKVLEYNNENQNWKALCALFQSELEPQCSDTSGNCGLSGCVTLSKELERHAKRSREIIESFEEVMKGVPQERFEPPANTWGRLQQPAPKKRKTTGIGIHAFATAPTLQVTKPSNEGYMLEAAINELSDGTDLPLYSEHSVNISWKDSAANRPSVLDAMDSENDGQAVSNHPTSEGLSLESYLRENPDLLELHLADAIMRDDENMANETLEMAKQQSYPLAEGWFSNSRIGGIWDIARVWIEGTPLGIYEIAAPFVLALACSCQPRLMRLLYKTDVLPNIDFIPPAQRDLRYRAHPPCHCVPAP